MAEKHHCGPDADKEFFAEIAKVMKKYPALAKKYHISCCDHQTDIMGIDYIKTAAVSRIEGTRIITEFKPRAEAEAMSSACCSYCFIDDYSGRYKCCAWWV